MKKFPRTIVDVPSFVEARFGDRTAYSGEVELSFSGLAKEVRRIAGAFFRYGIVKGDVVAILAANSAQWMLACLGAQSAGAIVVPINTRLKALEVGGILKKSGAKILISTQSLLTSLAVSDLGEMGYTDSVRVISLDSDWAEFLAGADASSIEEAVKVCSSITVDDPSDILFTSGTTGEPKGVINTHGQSIEVFLAWANCIGLCEKDRYLVTNPFFHTFGYKAGWLVSLMVGATVFTCNTSDVREIWRVILQENITTLSGPPTLFQSLLAIGEWASSGGCSLRLAVTGAASIPPVLIKRIKEELHINRVFAGYGLTEAAVVSISAQNDSIDLIATTVGKPLPGTEVLCVLPDGGQALPGQQGEIWVRGYNVMRGYFEDLSETAKAIDADGWLHTGDVGSFDDDGYLRITDRLKDMYISGGFNCYPAEIERLLCNHPSVAQACVIGIPDEILGSTGKAFVVLREGEEGVAGDDIMRWSRAAMADYKAPRKVEIVSSLPANALGKIQKHLLR